MTKIKKWDIGGTQPRHSQVKTRRKTEHSDEAFSAHYPQRRARENIIPTTDELAHLISRALSALSRGIYWDRGSIINIVL